MNIFPAIRRYYMYQGYVDMRKSFYGLGGLVRNEMNKGLLVWPPKYWTKFFWLDKHN